MRWLGAESAFVAAGRQEKGMLRTTTDLHGIAYYTERKNCDCQSVAAVESITAEEFRDSLVVVLWTCVSEVHRLNSMDSVPVLAAVLCDC